MNWVDLQCQKYIKEKRDVYIIYSNDTGELLWAVEVEESNGFWLDSFNTKDEAIDFCNKYGLKIIDII